MEPKNSNTAVVTLIAKTLRQLDQEGIRNISMFDLTAAIDQGITPKKVAGFLRKDMGMGSLIEKSTQGDHRGRHAIYWGYDKYSDMQALTKPFLNEVETDNEALLAENKRLKARNTELENALRAARTLADTIRTALGGGG
jgi:hypothetical protein